jgi:hypothetical protein
MYSTPQTHRLVLRVFVLRVPGRVRLPPIASARCGAARIAAQARMRTSSGERRASVPPTNVSITPFV